MRCWETPSKLQGKPDRKCATTISRATQSAAHRNAHAARCHQFVANNSFAEAHPLCSATNILPGNNLQQSHTQAAGYKARYALNASQPTIAPAGNGMKSSQ